MDEESRYFVSMYLAGRHNHIVPYGYRRYRRCNSDGYHVRELIGCEPIKPGSFELSGFILAEAKESGVCAHSLETFECTGFRNVSTKESTFLYEGSDAI